MASLKDAVGKTFPGFVVGVLTATVVLPLVGRGRGRSLLKTAIRGYLSLSDRLKESAAEAREQFHDLVAEVQQERQAEGKAEAEAEAEAEADAPPAEA